MTAFVDRAEQTDEENDLRFGCAFHVWYSDGAKSLALCSKFYQPERYIGKRALLHPPPGRHWY